MVHQRFPAGRVQPVAESDKARARSPHGTSARHRHPLRPQRGQRLPGPVGHPGAGRHTGRGHEADHRSSWRVPLGPSTRRGPGNRSVMMVLVVVVIVLLIISMTMMVVVVRTNINDYGGDGVCNMNNNDAVVVVVIVI